MYNQSLNNESSESQFGFESMINTPDFESIFGTNTAETLSQDDGAGFYGAGIQDSDSNTYHDVSSSSYEETYTLPEFVRLFTSLSLSPTSQGLLASGPSRDGLRSLLNTLEKPQLIELLSQCIVDSPSVAERVRGCVSKLTVFRRLLVRNISFQSTSEDVKSLLSSRYGPIEEGTVVYDRISGRSKGFAFMTFVSVESACNAILDSITGNLELNGRQVLLKFAADRDESMSSISTGGSIDGSSLLSAPSFGSSVPQPSTCTTPPPNRRHNFNTRKLFVYNLSPITTSESLGAVYGQYGPMEECFVVADSNGVSKRYAFVTFFTEDSTWRCLEEPSKLVDGQMTFTHLASEGPSSTSSSFQNSKPRNIRNRTTLSAAPQTLEANLSPLAELLNGLMLSGGKSL